MKDEDRLAEEYKLIAEAHKAYAEASEKQQKIIIDQSDQIVHLTEKLKETNMKKAGFEL